MKSDLKLFPRIRYSSLLLSLGCGLIVLVTVVLVIIVKLSFLIVELSLFIVIDLEFSLLVIITQIVPLGSQYRDLCLV